MGEGLTGDAYALPTKDHHLKVLPFGDIVKTMQNFVNVVASMPEVRFLLTPVGTGLAGYPINAIWWALKKAQPPSNVVLTSTWVTDNDL